MTTLPSASDLAAAHADLDALNGEARIDPTLIACWCCNERRTECRREDCPRRWRLKDCPPLASEGSASRHQVGGRK